MKAARKVFYNTIFLYVKLVITIVLALYSTRLILKSLGVVDFGIFSLVSGIIAMLSFLNGAMTVTTQRYLSFYLGKNEKGKNEDVFRTSVFLHLVIGVVIVLLLELLYVYMFDGWLKIPQARIESAKWVYHFMVINVFFTINAVPYDAMINAYEDLFFDSIVGIGEAVLRLGIAFYVIFTNYDKLIVYGLLMVILSILVRVVKSAWCKLRYEDCRVSIMKSMKPKLLKEMSVFTGWNLFGSLTFMARTQGLAVILNQFFGARINASYGIASQINSQLQSFSVLMVKAINPQIIKSEGGGDRERMIKLAIQSSKFSVFLLLFMIIPLLVEMPFLLNAWLIQVPPYATTFCMIILLNSIINQMSAGLKIAVLATGQIRLYNSVVGTTILLILPLSYYLLKFGMPPASVLLCGTFIEIISLFIRLIIVQKITGLKLSSFLSEIIAKVGLISILSAGVAIIPSLLMDAGLLRFVIVSFGSFLTCAILVWKVGINDSEKIILLHLGNGLLKRIGWPLRFTPKYAANPNFHSSIQREACTEKNKFPVK